MYYSIAKTYFIPVSVMFAEKHQHPAVLRNYWTFKEIKPYICDPFLKIMSLLGIHELGAEFHRQDREFLRDKLMLCWFWSMQFADSVE